MCVCVFESLHMKNTSGHVLAFAMCNVAVHAWLQVFSLLSGNVEKYLAPGLKLPVVLQYSPRDGSSHRGCLEVYMNNDLILTVSITT